MAAARAAMVRGDRCFGREGKDAEKRRGDGDGTGKCLHGLILWTAAQATAAEDAILRLRHALCPRPTVLAHPSLRRLTHLYSTEKRMMKIHLLLAASTLAAAIGWQPLQAAESVGQAASSAATTTGHAVAEASRQGGHAVAETGRDVGHATAEAGRQVGHETAKAGRAVGHETAEAGRTVGHETAEAGRKTKKAVKPASSPS
jgi:hypothetical protein